ncbi:MAG TPA: hypothetical protein VFH39_00150, partial [Candidatus Saccharimonadales bacterium]|nr:hypothetical protein [Candidatus Saccharimonadales bacterium]
SLTDGTGNDAERQTDIRALETQLEAFYAQNGYYPDLNDLNNPQWVSTNLTGIDKEVLKDPQGSGYTLAAKPAAHVYAYQPTSTAGGVCSEAKQDCQKYTLTATLSNGSSYTKASLN